MIVKKVIIPFALLLAFALLLVFVSTSIEMTTTVAGEVETVMIGYGSPWYQQTMSSAGGSRELNLLAPSFLSGIAGLFLILLSVRYYRKRTPDA